MKVGDDNSVGDDYVIFFLPFFLGTPMVISPENNGQIERGREGSLSGSG